MFAVLDESITEARLALAQKIYAVLWVILSIPLVVYFFVDSTWYNTNYHFLANFCGSALVLLSVIFFQFQAFYLTYVIYSTKKNKANVNVVKSITRAVLINLAIALLDWIALGVQFYQLFALDLKENYWLSMLCQQFATAIAALHGSLSIYVFIQFKKLTFAGTAVGARLKKKGLLGSLGMLKNKYKQQHGPISPPEILPTEIFPTEIFPTEISPI
jgi:hypothetical protein